MNRLILAGPYTGKTTVAKAGKAYDPELDKEGEFAKASEEYKRARDAGAPLAEVERMDDRRRAAYNADFEWQLRNKTEPVMVGHFSPDKFTDAKALGWEVRIVVLEPEVLRRRAREDPSPNETLKASRAAAAAEQLATLVHWLRTDGRWLDPKIYSSMDAALS